MGIACVQAHQRISLWNTRQPDMLFPTPHSQKRHIMDPYRELGVSPDASEEEIKSAYRALAKKYHPDANPREESAAEKMNRINAAYAMIRGGSADLFLEDDWYQTEDDYKRSILYHPAFRRVVVILIAASMAVVAVVSAFFSALWA